MSYTRTEEEGKDVLMFLSAEDAVVLESAPDSSIGGSLASGTAVETGTTPQEAYNEETGEINWDCPCLGPMTQPPCGETFKAAFSCFVYSKEDPKGIDCVDQFRAMQSCFREHPEIYGAELDDDDDDSSDNRVGDAAEATKDDRTSTKTHLADNGSTGADTNA